MSRQWFPTDVLPPAWAVPRLIVTDSRIVLSSPITASVRSPLYFKSCGIAPITANGKIVLRAPIVVQPSTTTWLRSFEPGPILTCGPTMHHGPTSTSRASSAPGWMIAVGWIAMLHVPLGHEVGHQLGLGRLLPVHRR